jgi:hypothetical protein
MADSFSEVTNTGWVSRIKSAFVGALAGIVLIPASFILLWLNEGNSAKSHAGLSEVSKLAVSVPADRVDAGNEGKPVHLTGKATTEEVLTDDRFQVSATVLRLTTRVEMFEWHESQTTEKDTYVGGEKTVTTYEYEKRWSVTPVDSSVFKHPEGHQNPPMPYESATILAEAATLGVFRLNEDLIGQIGGAIPLELTADHRAALSEEMRKELKDSDSGYYRGEDPSVPKVGDLRISFSVVPPAVVSFIAKQHGDTFEDFVARNGKRFSPLRMGELSIENVISAERSELKILTWALRLIGLILMVIGFAMIFKPLSVISGVLPFLGDIVAAGTFVMAILISLAFSLATIAAAWVAYRPLLGIPLLLVAIAFLMMALRKMGKAKKVRVAIA